MTAALADWQPSSPRPRRHLVPVPTGGAVVVREPAVRITRRGRLALTVLVTAVVALALFVGLAGAGEAAGGGRMVTVAPGQTLNYTVTVTVANSATTAPLVLADMRVDPLDDLGAREQLAVGGQRGTEVDGVHEVQRRPIKKLPALCGRTIINMFFEDSTRTRTSFEKVSAATSTLSPRSK